MESAILRAQRRQTARTARSAMPLTIARRPACRGNVVPGAFAVRTALVSYFAQRIPNASRIFATSIAVVAFKRSRSAPECSASVPNMRTVSPGFARKLGSVSHSARASAEPVRTEPHVSRAPGPKPGCAPIHVRKIPIFVRNSGWCAPRATVSETATLAKEDIL